MNLPMFKKEQSDNVQSTRENGSKTKRNVIIIAVVIVILIIIIALLLYMHSHSLILKDLKSSTMKETQVYNLKLKMPSSWKQVKKEKDEYTSVFLKKNGDNKAIVRCSIELLPGVNTDDDTFDKIYKKNIRGAWGGGLSKEITDHNMSNLKQGYTSKFISYKYKKNEKYSHIDSLVQCDKSFFKVSLLLNDSNWRGNIGEILKSLYDDIDFSHYHTQKVVAIQVAYDGSKEPGVDLASDNKGLTVTATYNDGEEKNVTNNCDIVGEELEPDSSSIYKITYTDRAFDNADYTKNLKLTCSVQVKSLKASYDGSTKKGTDIRDGLNVIATLKNGKKRTLAEYAYSLNGPSTLKAGKTNNYTIKYGKAKTDIQIRCTSKTRKQVLGIVKTKVLNKYLGSLFSLGDCSFYNDYNDEEEQVTFLDIELKMDTSGAMYLASNIDDSSVNMTWAAMKVKMEDDVAKIRRLFAKYDYPIETVYLYISNKTLSDRTLVTIDSDSGETRDAFTGNGSL